MQRLSAAVQRRMDNDDEGIAYIDEGPKLSSLTSLCIAVNAAGYVVNTCGWVDGQGYDLLVQCIQAFQIDVVLVIGQDRLFSRLQSSLAASNKQLSIVKLARSGGVVPLNTKHRSAKRLSRIREYFYGAHSLSLAIPTHSPCINEISFDDVDFFAIKGMSLAGPSTVY